MLGVRNNHIKDVGPVMIEHFAYGLPEFLLLDDAPAFDPEALADLGPVGIKGVEVFRSADIPATPFAP